jgi:alpha/beta superfamily hydrolase
VIRVVLAAVLLAVASASEAHAQDFEREARWRAEIVPGLVAGEAVDIPGPGGRAFLGLLTEPAGADRGGATLLVIVHGIGVHPDHGLIGKLRMDLADKGYATLAIQMPVLASDAPPEHYEPVFGNAAERIGKAAAWAGDRGYRDLVLLSHSLGGRMANAYFDRAPAAGFRKWVSLGLVAPYSSKFAQAPGVPVFDVYGERDLEAVLRSAPARERVAGASGGLQFRVAGTDHFYAGRETELVALIADQSRRR